MAGTSKGGGPTEEAQDGSDIVATYRRVLADDPEVTMPIAAIEALISVLGQTTSSTVWETLDIIKTEASRLRAAVPSSLPLTAGIDLFQQYLLRSLKKRGNAGISSGSGGGGGGNKAKDKGAAGSSGGSGSASISNEDSGFEETRQYLIRNSRLFASRAKAARAAIADAGARSVVTPGKVVLTGGGSRTVAAVLLRAAEQQTNEHGSPRFQVVYVVDPRFKGAGGSGSGSGSGSSSVARSVVAGLRARGVPVAEVDERAVAHVLRTAGVDVALLGAEVLCQNGGIFSRLGTFQLASLVSSFGKPVYVAAESHKIARVFPLGQRDLPRCGVQQELLFFRTATDAEAEAEEEEKKLENPDPVDYTPPNMITGVITEYGTKTPTGIFEMLLDIYS